MACCARTWYDLVVVFLRAGGGKILRSCGTDLTPAADGTLLWYYCRIVVLCPDMEGPSGCQNEYQNDTDISGGSGTL